MSHCLSLFFMWPEGLEATDGILAKSVYVHKWDFGREVHAAYEFGLHS